MFLEGFVSGTTSRDKNVCVLLSEIESIVDDDQSEITVITTKSRDTIHIKMPYSKVKEKLVDHLNKFQIKCIAEKAEPMMEELQSK